MKKNLIPKLFAAIIFLLCTTSANAYIFQITHESFLEEEMNSVESSLQNSQTCGFTGVFLCTHQLFRTLKCEQSGNTVHCDYSFGSVFEDREWGTIDGTLSNDGKTMTGTQKNQYYSAPIKIELLSYGDIVIYWETSTIHGVRQSGECDSTSSSEDEYTTDPLSEPESYPQEPGNLPADLCSGVNCKNNYCKADGSKFLYDCACDPEDGKCYCSGIDCPAGCDDALGGCIMQASGDPNEEDLCSGVQCEPDYCLDDQKTRMHDCKCDPADGECYCYSEICQAGCNMATGRCVESMVIDESGSSGGTQYPYPDDSPGLLGILGVVGGGGLAIGGGYLGIKALQGALARRAAKAAAESAAEPTLRELLSQAEKSADRAIQAIDQAQKAGQADQQGYKEFLKRRTGYDEHWAQHMNDRAALIEKAEYAVTKIKKGTDVAADLLGNVPGAGDTFKAIYDYSTTAAESIASGDSAGEVILKTTSKFVENKVSGKLFGKLTTMEWLPTRLYKRSIKVACRQVGAKNLIVESTKNELTNSAMNSLKKIKSKTSFGKIEKRVEAVAKRADRKGISRMIKKVLYSK